MPLEELNCADTGLLSSNAVVLAGMKTLKTINEKPAAVFWKEIDAKKN